MRLHQLGDRRLLLVERRDASVPLRVVVAGVDDDLAGEEAGRQVLDLPERDRDGDEVGRSGIRCGPCCRPFTEFEDELGEGLGSAGVRDDHVVAVRDGGACELGADVA